MKRRRRNAFSLTEVIVSMALVVVISAVGFLACALANRIGARSDDELKGYMDAEKMRLCLDSAYDAVGGDYALKDDYVCTFLQCAEWYFEADGLWERVESRLSDAEEWIEELPIRTDGEGENVRSISVYYYGDSNGLKSYAYLVTVTDSGHSVRCNINCRTAVFIATVSAVKNGSSLAFYERSFHYGE